MILPGLCVDSQRGSLYFCLSQLPLEEEELIQIDMKKWLGS